LLLLALGTPAGAQPVLAPPPVDFTQAPPTFRPARTNQLEAPEPGLVTRPANEAPLQWGPVQLRPHVFYRFSYGDGIPARPGEQFTTAIHELAPGLLFQLGDHWTLDYTPTLRFYSSDRFQDTVDHSVMFGGGTGYEDWTFGLSQGYASSSQPLIETARQTDQESYATALHATRQLSSKLSLELGLNQDLRFLGGTVSTNELTDSKVWSTMDWLNYQARPDFGAALGVGGGYVQVNPGSDMTFEQVQGRIQWRPGTKLSLVLNGGFEDRQFLDSDAPAMISPIYGAAIQYQLFEPTTLSLNANHTVSASYFQDQVTESTDVNGGLRQRFFKKLYLDLTGGYRKTSYKATILTTFYIINLNRVDDYAYVNVRLSVRFLKRGTMAVFYQASDNASNAGGYTSSSRQGGFELGYRF
jgi:hypothetical protein